MNALLMLTAKVTEAVATMTANVTCICFLHQPKFPESVKSFVSFNVQFGFKKYCWKNDIEKYSK